MAHQDRDADAEGSEEPEGDCGHSEELIKKAGKDSEGGIGKCGDHRQLLGVQAFSNIDILNLPGAGGLSKYEIIHIRTLSLLY